MYNGDKDINSLPKLVWPEGSEKAIEDSVFDTVVTARNGSEIVFFDETSPDDQWISSDNWVDREVIQ